MQYRRRAGLAALLLLSAVPVVTPHPLLGQSSNFTLPIADIEARLRAADFSILDWRGSRRAEDRTQRAILMFEDSIILAAKWASAPRGGGRFNNQPRYEAAAYEIQKLFLDDVDFVVPPTVIRAFPLEFVTAQVDDQRPTFGEAPRSVVAALQYWLSGVQPGEFWVPDRVQWDTLYARRLANFNILTYLIGHRDSNIGNFLMSEDPADPRVFAVDNGVSFGSEPGNRGEDWKEMRVRRLPRGTIERLERVTREDLERILGVVAEFQIRDGELVPVEPSENFSRNRGVRTRDDRVQFGLTAREIRDVELRLSQLLRDASGRRYELF